MALSIRTKGASLLSNIAWNSCGSLVYLAANWLLTVLVVLFDQSYTASGTLAVAMSVGNIAATIVLFRTRTIQVSDINNEYKSIDFIFLKILSSGLAIAICFIYSLFTVKPECLWTVMLYVMFKISDSIVDAYHGIDQKHSRLDIAGKSQIIRGLLLVPAFAIAFKLFDSLNASFIAMFALTLLTILFYDIPASKRLEQISIEFNAKRIGSLVLVCVPGFIAGLLCTAVVSYARQYYGFNIGTSSLGIYAAIATPAVIVQALAGYIYAPFLGPIAEMYASRDSKKIGRFLLWYCLALLIILAVCIVVFNLIGDAALTIFYGSEIASYSWLMTPILVCTALTACIFFLVDVLIVFRSFTGAVCVSCLSYIFCLVSCGCFINYFGMNGISYCIIMSYFLGCVVAFCFLTVQIKNMHREAM